MLKGPAGEQEWHHLVAPDIRERLSKQEVKRQLCVQFSDVLAASNVTLIIIIPPQSYLRVDKRRDGVCARLGDDSNGD